MSLTCTDGFVKSELFFDPLALLVSSRNSYNVTSHDLANLTDD
jgi:hypothetical protein